MWMRFDLFARVAPATDFAAVKAPKLGVWQKSAPGRVEQRLRLHPARPGADRARLVPCAGALPLVRQGRQAAALGHAHERDLQAARPAPGPARRQRSTPSAAPLPDQATYELDVRNDGRTAAGRFDVVLTVGGAEQPAQHVAGGSRRRPRRR